MEKTRVLILIAVTAVMIFLYGGIDYASEPYSGWDLSSYRAMASSSPALARDIGKPFVYRILGPYLAGLLPMSDPVAFRVLSVSVSMLLILAFYCFLRRTGLTSNMSLIAAVLVTFNKHWFGFATWDYFQLNDVLSLLFILAMLWSMLEERWPVFGAALLLGALTKETSMLMVPVLLVYLVEKRAPARTWGRAITAVVPGIAAFAALRVLLPTVKGNAPIEALLAYWGKLRSPERVLRLLVNSYLPFSLVPVVMAVETARFFKERKYALALAALTFFGALFGANDERLMAPAFIVVYALVGVVIQDLALGKRGLMVMIVAGFASSLHHIFARYPLPGRGVTEVLSVGALLVVTSTLAYYRLKRSGLRGRRRAVTP
jgi:hypothetical protein